MEGDGAEEESEPLDEAEPDVVAALLTGAGPEGPAGGVGGVGRDEDPEPDGPTGSTGLPDFAGEACPVGEEPAVGEAPPGAPPTGPDPLAEFSAVARWTGRSGCDCAGVRSTCGAEAGRTAGAGAGDGAADSVLLTVPGPLGALPGR
ncbi:MULTISPECIES: hypothetical protein [Streptomyces]|uniref:Uncharacterized protein n=1 Tax=Streptomyces fungicidicus TaxID=68203 RepID=A0ACC7Y3G1_9ACTN|nr:MULTISPECIES: hypothetical protein [Streptomyces]MBF4133106.1 hypothetical protein [Streptomyces albidoflavus]NUV76370.1 hypothetical protein [Streptomyces fungicidicus]